MRRLGPVNTFYLKENINIQSYVGKEREQVESFHIEPLIMPARRGLVSEALHIAQMLVGIAPVAMVPLRSPEGPPDPAALPCIRIGLFEDRF